MLWPHFLGAVTLLGYKLILIPLYGIDYSKVYCLSLQGKTMKVTAFSYVCMKNASPLFLAFTKQKKPGVTSKFISVNFVRREETKYVRQRPFFP